RRFDDIRVVNQDRRRHVVAVWNPVVFIEPACGRQISCGTAQVPFAYAHRLVARRLKHLCDRNLGWSEAARIRRLKYGGDAATYAVASCEQGSPRGRADR